MIAGGDDVNIQFEEFFGERGSDAEAGGGIFAVGDDKIDELIADDAGQTVFDDGASGASEDVADEENAHDERRNSMVTRGVGRAYSPAGGRQASLDWTVEATVPTWMRFLRSEFRGAEEVVVAGGI